MTDLLTAAQMRAVEVAAIAAHHVTGLELMERAGRGVVDAVFAMWPDLVQTAHRARVLCGPGNNGGDGYVVARLLREWGWLVDVVQFGDPAALPPDARTNHDRWLELGPVAPLASLDHSLAGYDLAVDALFGTGLTRGLSGDLDAAVSVFASDHGPAGCRRVAVDLPSGLCSDSGRPLGPVAKCDLTVTFHTSKPGHYLGEGPNFCGRVQIADIGLAARLRSFAAGPIAELVNKPGTNIGKVNAGAAGKGSTHKYSHGHVLVLAGPPGRGGAARLAARGALRIGAGLVTLGCPAPALAENAAQLNAIMLREVDGPDDAAAILGDPRISAVALGPGLGVADAARALVGAVLKSERPAVLDADALTGFAEAPDRLFQKLHGDVVLTPHAGEFGRLFPDLLESLKAPPHRGPAYSKLDAARAASARAGCTVLFKGADTVIAAPDGRCGVVAAVYDNAAPWLATAGSGDVLCGFIAGLLARGFEPFKAAATAAWLHVACARKFGPGLIAEDLPEMLPGVFGDLGV